MAQSATEHKSRKNLMKEQRRVLNDFIAKYGESPLQIFKNTTEQDPMWADLAKQANPVGSPNGCRTAAEWRTYVIENLRKEAIHTGRDELSSRPLQQKRPPESLQSPIAEKRMTIEGEQSQSPYFDGDSTEAPSRAVSTDSRNKAERSLAKITEQMRNHATPTIQEQPLTTKKLSPQKERRAFLEPLQQITQVKTAAILKIVKRCKQKEMRYREELIGVNKNLHERLQLFREYERKHGHRS